MKQDVAKRWSMALRSGQYKQGSKYLCLDQQFCCLGVLAELSDVVRKDDSKYQRYDIFGNSNTSLAVVRIYGDGAISSVPKDVAVEAEMICTLGARRDRKELVFRDRPGHYQNLAHANDCGIPFTAIAEYIDENWEQL